MKNEQVSCPLTKIISIVNQAFGSESEFRRHLRQSKIEFLKAFRSLIDLRITQLESVDKKNIDAQKIEVR